MSNRRKLPPEPPPDPGSESAAPSGKGHGAGLDKVAKTISKTTTGGYSASEQKATSLGFSEQLRGWAAARGRALADRVASKGLDAEAALADELARNHFLAAMHDSFVSAFWACLSEHDGGAEALVR